MQLDHRTTTHPIKRRVKDVLRTTSLEPLLLLNRPKPRSTPWVRKKAAGRKSSPWAPLTQVPSKRLAVACFTAP